MASMVLFLDLKQSMRKGITGNDVRTILVIVQFTSEHASDSFELGFLGSLLQGK